jgi:hypothetical protein
MSSYAGVWARRDFIKEFTAITFGYIDFVAAILDFGDGSWAALSAQLLCIYILPKCRY